MWLILSSSVAKHRNLSFEVVCDLSHAYLLFGTGPFRIFHP